MPGGATDQQLEIRGLNPYFDHECAKRDNRDMSKLHLEIQGADGTSSSEDYEKWVIWQD